ncbi:hypothetical protein BP6252_00623 [Coleophoma cylindrospora]|uniref:Uncharacterized protein n=1 Tax=Coleophoma cylindrospora TaxID=1849047 RepID=A0A3D8SQZ0_9HELO|nr:hypothetical protein BP6252_00623 [Coleophoma cylindrospora]
MGVSACHYCLASLWRERSNNQRDKEREAGIAASGAHVHHFFRLRERGMTEAQDRTGQGSVGTIAGRDAKGPGGTNDGADADRGRGAATTTSSMTESGMRAGPASESAALDAT